MELNMLDTEQAEQLHNDNCIIISLVGGKILWWVRLSVCLSASVSSHELTTNSAIGVSRLPVLDYGRASAAGTLLRFFQTISENTSFWQLKRLVTLSTYRRYINNCIYLSISKTTHLIFTNFSLHVAYGRGSVLLRQGDEIQRGKGSFGDFLPHCDNAL